MSDSPFEPTPGDGPVPVPDAVRGPYAPPPGRPAAYAPVGTPSVSGPTGTVPATSGTIGRFAAPKRRGRLLLALLAGIAVAAVLIATGLIKPPVPVGPAPSGTASPTPTFTGRGAPFTMPDNANAHGSWEVVEHEWVADGVHVHVRVYALASTLQYGFQAYPKGSSKAVKPEAGSAKTPELTAGSLAAGQVADGWLFLPLPREETTFFITSRSGRLLSAQPILP